MKSEKTMNQIISRIAEKHNVSTKHVYSQIEKALRRSPNIDFSSTYLNLNNIDQPTQAVDNYILSLAILASIRIKE
jgi:hypothetical protein